MPDVFKTYFSKQILFIQHRHQSECFTVKELRSDKKRLNQIDITPDERCEGDGYKTS